MPPTSTAKPSRHSPADAASRLRCGSSLTCAPMCTSQETTEGALHYSAVHGHLDTTKLLLELGADGEVMTRLQVLPSELVREVIEWF